MNPHITDLLDDYADTSVQLFSPDQVLRGTGSGKKKSPNPKPAHHRMKKPLVAAAALLLVLTGISAGYLTFSRGNSGSSLGDGLSEIPEISAVSPTPEPPQENIADSAESAVETVPEDIVLDDTADTQEAEQTVESTAELDLSPAEDLHTPQPVVNNTGGQSTSLTSATGLRLYVMDVCNDAGEARVDDTISLINPADGTEWDLDVVFAFFDQINMEFGGFLWAVVSGSPEQLPMELPDGYMCDKLGELDGETYSILIPTYRNPQYNENSYAATNSYNTHVLATDWCLTQITATLTTAVDDPDWTFDYAEQVLEPVTKQFSKLDWARQNNTSPSDSSLNLPAAQDTDGDGLLTAELNIPVETKYGTAILQKFTLDPSSLKFSWNTDLSGLSGTFAEYSGDYNSALLNDDFQMEYIEVQNAVQEVILTGMLVYPDNSHVCMFSGERIDFDTQRYRTFDTLGVGTLFPISDEAPSCLEIGGVTYSLS